MKVSGGENHKPRIDVINKPEGIKPKGGHKNHRNTSDDKTTVTVSKEGKKVTIRHGRVSVGRPKKK
jgi:hypothetical protein